MGYMAVVIPPDIVDETSEGSVAHEGGNIKLRCFATGLPEPNVTWRREDGRAIVLRENGKKNSEYHVFFFFFHYKISTC